MTDYYCENCKFFEDKSTDKLIDGFCKKYNQPLNFYDWWEKCDKCIIDTLQSENAALRERLEKAEIPCHVDEILYEPFINYIREWIVDSIYVGAIGIDVNCHKKDDYKWHDSFAIRKKYNDFGEKGRVCLTREAALARLAELKGGKE